MRMAASFLRLFLFNQLGILCRTVTVVPIPGEERSFTEEAGPKASLTRCATLAMPMLWLCVARELLARR